jgi:hypothetical protein
VAFVNIIKVDVDVDPVDVDVDELQYFWSLDYLTWASAEM